MGSPVTLRDDFDAAGLRLLAKRTRDADQGRRLVALAAIYDGGSRGDAARIGSVGLQTVRDRVLRFDAAGPDGLVDGKAPGQTPKLNDAQRQALTRIVEEGPIPAVHGVVRWRLVDLAQWVWGEFRISISKQTLSRERRAMGLRKLSARPRHQARNEYALEAFKKLPHPRGGHRAPQGRGRTDRDPVPGRSEGRPEEQDHAPLGQARHPPRTRHDQRTKSAYIFGAICPQEGRGAGLVLPFCNSAAMDLHLREISQAVAARAHAVPVMDQAGRHTSAKLDVPDNITILTLPPRSPELNPVENIWQFLRDNRLSNRVFTSHDDIVDHCCDAWNKLVDQPWKIMSIGHREWAHPS